MHTRLLPRLQIACAALLFSTGGMAIKSCGLSSWQVASFRCGVAALVLYALMPAARSRPTRLGFFVGVAYSATMILYVLSNKTTTAANAIFLQSTAPIYVLLLAPWLLKERIRRVDVLVTSVMGVGLLLFFLADTAASATAPNPALGNILATCAGLGWALTVMGLRLMEGRGGGRSSVQAVLIGNVLTFVCLLPLALPVADAIATDWLWILFLGTFQIALAYFFLTSGLDQVSALEASLLLLLEPVLSPVWAFLVHGEVPAPLALLGASVILLATMAKALLDFRRRPESRGDP